MPETPQAMEKTITDLSQLNPEGIYTYADYLLWRLEERIELIKGRIFTMPPAPSLNYQKVSVALVGSLFSFFPKTPANC
jgi:hypothetical protein